MASKEEHDDLEKPPKDSRKLSALDRAILTALGQGRVVGRADDPAAKALPSLWEWLTKTDGGKDYIMQPAVISLQLGPEGALATITHRDLRVSCSVAVPFLAECLKALEEALTGPNPPLRTWGKDLPNLKKRRQK